MIKHCYIHIPFCDNICSYCDFCKMYYKEEIVDEYLESLEQEIKSIYQNEELETIYIGGGTPSSLTIKQLQKLFSILSIFKKSKNIEYTIEGNIESTTEEKLLLYKENGINRLSFGIESINQNNLEYLERSFSKEKTEKVLKTARRLGFQNINLDLIYAIPRESIEILKEDIKYVLSLKPEHISTYSLMIEDHTKLKIKNEKNMDEDLDEEMYQVICNVLKENDYIHYEISNFCKEDFQSRHNLCYWKNKEYYGFGLGASSYQNEKRITNTRSLKDYKSKKYQKDIEIVSIKDKIEYQILLNLRTKEGINLSLFKKEYNKELKEIYHYQKLLEGKYLEELENHLFIPENKWYISNEIIVRLLGCDQNE